MANPTDTYAPFDFYQRAFQFAKRCRLLTKEMPQMIGNKEDGKQLIRSSGSVGANYLESQRAMSKKDALKSLKVSRKESLESIHWLRLLDIDMKKMDNERTTLIQEANELFAILTAIIRKIE